jgi:hypothetical protein
MIETVKPTQFQWPQDALRRILNLPTSANDIYVTPIDAGAGGAANHFVIRLHDEDANSYSELARIVAALEQRFQFASPARIVGIELALDFYSRIESIAALREMTLHLQSGIAARGNARQYDPDPNIKTKKGRMRRLGDGHRLNPDWMLYIGNKGDPVRWQTYLKCVDVNQRPIQPRNYRARVEFTLNEEKLLEYGLTRLSDLADYRFAAFADLLHFRRLKPIDAIIEGKSRYFAYAIKHYWHGVCGSVTAYPFGWLAFQRDARTGKPRHRGMGKSLKYHRHSIADDELNRLVRKKLHDLSKRFST